MTASTQIRRSKRFIGRRVVASHPKSPLFGRHGTIAGFRGDQDKDNPYVQVMIDGLHIETISARSLRLID